MPTQAFGLRIRRLGAESLRAHTRIRVWLSSGRRRRGARRDPGLECDDLLAAGAPAAGGTARRPTLARCSSSSASARNSSTSARGRPEPARVATTPRSRCGCGSSGSSPCSSSRLRGGNVGCSRPAASAVPPSRSDPNRELPLGRPPSLSARAGSSSDLSVSYAEPVIIRSVIAGALSAGCRHIVVGLPPPDPDGEASMVATSSSRRPLGAGSRRVREDRLADVTSPVVGVSAARPAPAPGGPHGHAHHHQGPGWRWRRFWCRPLRPPRR